MRINGIQNFEAHLAEVIWRNHNRGTPGTVYERFFDLLRKIYHLQGPAALTAPRPLFDTWRENVTDVPEHMEYKVIRVGSQDIADQPDQPFEYVSETTSQASSTPRTLDPRDPHVVPETPPQPSVAQGLHVFMPEGYQEVTPEAGSREEKRHVQQGKKHKKKKSKKEKTKKRKHDRDGESQRRKKRINYRELADMLTSDSDFE